MTNFRLLGAAAILSSVLAGPVMAQQVISNPGKCQAQYPNANCLNEGPGNPYIGAPRTYRHPTAYRSDQRGPNDQANWNNGRHDSWHDNWNDNWNDSWNDNRWDRHDSGFWPGDVAADIVGGAVGTAGAIATAPFRGDSYAYYNGGYRGGYDQSWAARNGFVCQPGTWFKGDDGRRHICQ
jgi:hypothetical protein